MGWYAFARALRPKIIMESWIRESLTCLLTAALKINEEEGHKGSNTMGLILIQNAG